MIKIKNISLFLLIFSISGLNSYIITRQTNLFIPKFTHSISLPFSEIDNIINSDDYEKNITEIFDKCKERKYQDIGCLNNLLKFTNNLLSSLLYNFEDCGKYSILLSDVINGVAWALWYDHYTVNVLVKINLEEKLLFLSNINKVIHEISKKLDDDKIYKVTEVERLFNQYIDLISKYYQINDNNVRESIIRTTEEITNYFYILDSPTLLKNGLYVFSLYNNLAQVNNIIKRYIQIYNNYPKIITPKDKYKKLFYFKYLKRVPSNLLNSYDIDSYENLADINQVDLLPHATKKFIEPLNITLYIIHGFLTESDWLFINKSIENVVNNFALNFIRITDPKIDPISIYLYLCNSNEIYEELADILLFSTNNGGLTTFKQETTHDLTSFDVRREPRKSIKCFIYKYVANVDFINLGHEFHHAMIFYYAKYLLEKLPNSLIEGSANYYDKTSLEKDYRQIRKFIAKTNKNSTEIYNSIINAEYSDKELIYTGGRFLYEYHLEKDMTKYYFNNLHKIDLISLKNNTENFSHWLKNKIRRHKYQELTNDEKQSFFYVPKNFFNSFGNSCKYLLFNINSRFYIFVDSKVLFYDLKTEQVISDYRNFKYIEQTEELLYDNNRLVKVSYDGVFHQLITHILSILINDILYNNVDIINEVNKSLMRYYTKNIVFCVNNNKMDLLYFKNNFYDLMANNTFIREMQIFDKKIKDYPTYNSLRTELRRVYYIKINPCIPIKLLNKINHEENPFNNINVKLVNNFIDSLNNRVNIELSSSTVFNAFISKYSMFYNYLLWNDASAYRQTLSINFTGPVNMCKNNQNTILKVIN